MKKKITLILFGISVFMILLAKNCTFAAEYIFARGIYKLISVPFGFITGIIPFSIGEVILILLLILLITGVFAGIIFIIYKGIKRQKIYLGRNKIKNILWNVLLSISVILFMFVILCGTNYYRYDFEKYCDFSIEEYTEKDLYNLCLYLAKKTNETRKLVDNTDKNGVMKLEKSFYKTAKAATKAMRKLSKEYPSVGYVSGGVKPVILSKYMSYTDIVGIYCPFTMEANVNCDITDYNIPFNMCHELAHLSGYMKEDEANYIAYLACINSENNEFIYSGYISALIYSTNELYNSNINHYKDIKNMLSDEVIKDINEDSIYWKRYEDSKTGQVISQVSNNVNNGYLQINGQEEGVESYNKIVTLLIADYLNMK